MIRRFLTHVLAAAAVLGSAAIAAAQSVDEIVAKNLAAKGGVEKLRAIQTIRQTSRMNMQGMDAPMVVLGKRPNLLRQEITLGSQRVIHGFDGQAAWIVNPLVSPGAAPIRITGPQADSIREQSGFDPPLMNYQERGYRIELAGTEKVGDVQVHHLRLTPPPSPTGTKPQVQHAYLDTSTGLEVKLVTESEGNKFEQELLDYRDVEGVKVPFRIRMLINGVLQSEIKVEKVEFNVKIDDAVFRMPSGKG